MLSKTQGIVLHSFKYSENALITSIYTREYGRVSCLIQGVHTKKSKFKPAFFQPLSIVEIELQYLQNKDLQMLKDIAITKPLHSLHSDPYKNAIVLFLGEILYRTLREGEHGEQLFNYVSHSIELLDTMTEGFINFHLVFTVHLTKYLGFFPENLYSDKTSFFNLKTAAFETRKSAHCIDKETSMYLSDILISDFSNIKLLELNKQLRTTILQTIVDFYMLHLPGLKDIKSLEVLTSVFG
jgi:DNA repair protein RecO (recombination protein O)